MGGSIVDVEPLAERIAASMRDGDRLEVLLFDTTDPVEVASVIEAVAPGRVVGSLGYGVSVGCVAALRLEDGAEVVVKVHQPRWSTPYLRRAVAVQAACAAAGLPAPQPIAGPVPCGAGLATVESYLPDPGAAEPTRGLLPVSAAGFAAVTSIAASVELPSVDQPLDRAEGALYPQPHSPIFDFERTAAGADWIDDLGRRALAVIEGADLSPVVTHTDWAARNVRFGAEGLLAIYDWDSIAATTEAEAVGAAAQTWRALGRWEDETAPAVDEVLEYVEAYGDARHRPLDRAERRVAAASALWVLAYSARCEHSLVPEGYEGRSRSRLHEDGDALLRAT